MTSSGKAREGGKCRLGFPGSSTAVSCCGILPFVLQQTVLSREGSKNKRHNSLSSPEMSNSPPRNVRLPLRLVSDFQGKQQGPEAYAWAGNGGTQKHTYRPSHSGPCSDTSPCLLASCSKAVIRHICQAWENFQYKCSACTVSRRQTFEAARGEATAHHGTWL